MSVQQFYSLKCAKVELRVRADGILFTGLEIPMAVTSARKPPAASTLSRSDLRR